MKVYPEVWTKFTQCSTTLGLQIGELEKWHRNRTRYAIWILRIRSRKVLAWLEHCQNQLLEWVIPVQEPHVTLWVSGFPTNLPEHDDDVLIDDLEHAAKNVQDGPRIGVRLGQFNSFQTAAFIEVEDHLGHLAKCRKQLNTHREIRFDTFIPHITLGCYSDSFPIKPIQDKLKQLEPMPWQLTFDSVDWVELNAKSDRQKLQLVKQVNRRGCT